MAVAELLNIEFGMQFCNAAIILIIVLMKIMEVEALNVANDGIPLRYFCLMLAHVRANSTVLIDFRIIMVIMNRVMSDGRHIKSKTAISALIACLPIMAKLFALLNGLKD